MTNKVLKNPKSDISNYDISKIKARKSFLECTDSNIRSHISDLEFDDSFYYIKYIGAPYRINKHTGEAAMLSGTDWIDANFNAVLTLYDILGHTERPLVLSSTFKSLQALNRIQSGYNHVLGNTFFSRFTEQVSQSPNNLAEALKSLNGVKMSKGDVSYKIPIAFNIEVIVEFWEADDEFPAQINYFFNDNILDFLHYETLWYLLGNVNERILTLMSKL